MSSARVIELKRGATYDPGLDPGMLTAFHRRDETARLIDRYQHPTGDFEDLLEREARAYLGSPLRELMPFVAFLLARGVGRCRS